MDRVLLIFLLAVTRAASAELVDEVRATFTWRGAAVHPAIVELFSDWISDPVEPQVLAVDLSTAQDSNRFRPETSTHDASGWVRVKRADANDHTEFGYHFVGTLPSGTIVLHAYESGGGSGTFESVMLLAASVEHATASDGGRRDRQVLTVLRIVILGDRADARLSLAGTRVTVERAHAHDESMRATLVLDDPQLPEVPQPRK